MDLADSRSSGGTGKEKNPLWNQLKSQPRTEHKRQRKKRAQKGRFDYGKLYF